MFRIVKFVSPWGNHVDSLDFYLTDNGFWSADADAAKHFHSSSEADKLVEQLNKKADRHYCHSMSKTYQITTYVKEEI